MSVLISPSILSADFGHLQNEVDSVESSADALHFDVMDGHFVPNLSFGALVGKCIRTKLPLDVHLMVTNPADRIVEFQNIGSSNITFHAEVVEGTASRRALIAAIRKTNATAGISLNPATPLPAIDDIVGEIDRVLVMSVQPGFGGQEFVSAVLEKVRALRKRFPRLMIQIDGGIDEETAKLARDAGADNLVAGKAIFSAKDRETMIRTLRG
ncbi:MAG: ribulose-phosphate 3-epimerase [Candidatus Peribacteraceae bacterium]